MCALADGRGCQTVCNTSEILANSDIRDGGRSNPITERHLAYTRAPVQGTPISLRAGSSPQSIGSLPSLSRVVPERTYAGIREVIVRPYRIVH